MKEKPCQGAPTISYRSDLGAALARIDALEPKARTLPAELPSKRSLFTKLRDLFVSEPGRWTRHTIRLEVSGNYPDPTKDGWVCDFAREGRMLGFYLTGIWWIRVGEVTCESNRACAKENDRSDWVYIFCPRFRRAIRRRRHWLLLKDLETK